MIKELKTLGKHSSIYGISNILRKAIGFIMIPVYTAYLTPKDYGVIELFDLTLEVLGMIVGLRLGGAMIRYFHLYENHDDKMEVISTAFISSCILSGTALFFLLLFNKQIAVWASGNESYAVAFQIIFICFAIQNVYLIAENYLIIQKKSFLYSMLSIAILFLSLFFNILFIVYFKLGFWGIILSMIIAKTINLLVVVPLTLKDLKIKFSLHKFYKMLKFSLPLIPASISLFIIHFSDRFFIQKFCDLNELGLYSLGYKFGMILSVIVSQPVFRIWNTQRYEVIKQDDGKTIYSKIFTYYFLVLVLSSLGICIFIDEIIKIMASSDYQNARTVVPLIVVGYALFGMTSFFNFGMFYKLQTKYLAIVQITTALINLLLNYLLIGKFGIMGAATTTTISFLVMCILSLYISQKLFYIPFEYRRIMTIISVAGLIYTMTLLYNFNLFVSISLKLLTLCCFPLILFMINFFSSDEKKYIFEASQKVQLKFKAVLFNSIS